MLHKARIQKMFSKKLGRVKIYYIYILKIIFTYLLNNL